MEEPEAIDDELENENREEQQAEPNAGPSIAGLLLIVLGIGWFVHPLLRAEWMAKWTIVLLNWPIAGAMIGGGIGAFSKNGARGAKYGIVAGICIAGLFVLNGRFNPIGN